jgi:hypothetical protein
MGVGQETLQSDLRHRKEHHRRRLRAPPRNASASVTFELAHTVVHRGWVHIAHRGHLTNRGNAPLARLVICDVSEEILILRTRTFLDHLDTPNKDQGEKRLDGEWSPSLSDGPGGNRHATNSFQHERVMKPWGAFADLPAPIQPLSYAQVRGRGRHCSEPLFLTPATKTHRAIHAI